MRFFKMKQSITFLKDMNSGSFQSGETVIFNGYLRDYNSVMEGYMESSTIEHQNPVLYIKGYRDFFGKMILVETTKQSSQTPMTLCSYFPCIFDKVPKGYLSETDSPTLTNEKYFFQDNTYLAKIDLYLDLIEFPIPGSKNHIILEYENTKKKVNQMLAERDKARAKDILRCGKLFDFMPPYSPSIRPFELNLIPQQT